MRQNPQRNQPYCLEKNRKHEVVQKWHRLEYHFFKKTRQRMFFLAQDKVKTKQTKKKTKTEKRK